MVSSVIMFNIDIFFQNILPYPIEDRIHNDRMLIVNMFMISVGVEVHRV